MRRQNIFIPSHCVLQRIVFRRYAYPFKLFAYFASSISAVSVFLRLAFLLSALFLRLAFLLSAYFASSISAVGVVFASSISAFCVIFASSISAVGVIFAFSFSAVSVFLLLAFRLKAEISFTIAFALSHLLYRICACLV
ncbi:MAG: hypothetical protein RSA24_01675 [Clostridia bacterium]